RRSAITAREFESPAASLVASSVAPLDCLEETMTAPSPPERRTLGWLQNWVHLVLLAVFVVIVVVRGLTLWWRHADSLNDGRERAGAIAHILAEHLAGTIAGLDAALVQLSVHSRQVGGPRAPASAWDPVLRATLAAL